MALARRRILTIGVVCLAAAGAGMGLWLGLRSSAPVYTTATAGIGTINQTVSASGTLEAVNQADANFAVSGQVTAVTASVGETVTAGEPLAQLGTTDLSRQVQQDSATLSADEAKLASDEAAASSASASNSAGNGSNEASITAEIDSDDAQILGDQGQLATAQADLAEATLVSPIAGTVVTVNLIVGENVAAGGSSSGAEVEIQDTSSYEVNATISAAEVSNLKVGDQVDVAPSSSHLPVFGTVSSIALVPTVSNGVATFPFVVMVTGDPADLYSGVSANLTVIVRDVANVLTVPTSAVDYDGNATSVEVLNRGKEVRRTVKAGASDALLTQITAGLSSGEKVVLANDSAGIPASGNSSPGGGFSFEGPAGGGPINVHQKVISVG